MPRPRFLDVAHVPVLGMIHLDALPGSPSHGRRVGEIEDRARADLQALIVGGVDGVILENFHDAPFYPRRVPAETVAAMAAIARCLRDEAEVPIGINVLRNDGVAALAIAAAVNARFIRVNVLVGARLTDQGIVQGIAHELLRARRRMGAEEVAILADVAVKHSAALADYPLEQEIADARERGLADALIVSGPGTGRAIDLDRLRSARRAAGDTPVLAGSGVTMESAARLAGLADGLIVGTAFKGADGRVVPERVRKLVKAARGQEPAGS